MKVTTNQAVSNKIIMFAVASILVAPLSTYAGGITYKDGDKYLKVGARIQLQYHQENPSVGETTDEIIFRRLRPYIEGSAHKDWKGKIQWDMGKGKLSIMDAYMQYKGLSKIKMTIGNAMFPFSREMITSSKRQQLVERTLVGSSSYGSPSRNVGVHLKGSANDKHITWGFSLANASVDPDNKKIDFDTPISHARGDDWSDGWMLGGRLDFHPLGYLKFGQGDFKRKTKATISLAAFSWSNDGDNLDASRSKEDVDSVTGLEISGALRHAGFSVDAQINSFNSDTVAAGFTGGLYKNGTTTLTNAVVEGGYMINNTIEIVAGFQTQDADGYATSWNRTSIGANWYINKHDTKVQLTYRMGESLDGTENKDMDEVFLQTQFVF